MQPHRACVVLAAALLVLASAPAACRDLAAAAAAPPAAQSAAPPAPPKQQPPLGPGWVQLKEQLAAQQQNATSGPKAGGSNATSSRAAFVEIPPQKDRLVKAQPAGGGSNETAGPFKCGAPGAPCGAALPKDAKCPRGPGWCSPGHYCGWQDTTAEPSRCLPLPENCGQVRASRRRGRQASAPAAPAAPRHCGAAPPHTPPANRPPLPPAARTTQEGYACCPSNAEAPHVTPEDKLYRKPFCKGGATCYYFAPVAGLNNGDAYAGNPGESRPTAATPPRAAARGSVPAAPRHTRRRAAAS